MIQEEIDHKIGLAKDNEAYFREINNQFELAQNMLETEARFASFLKNEEIDKRHLKKRKTYSTLLLIMKHTINER